MGQGLDLRVDDGETEPIEGTILVTVTASTRSLPTATDDVIPEAHQGKTVSVDVLANDFNPFPETPLKVVSAATEADDWFATLTEDARGGALLAEELVDFSRELAQQVARRPSGEMRAYPVSTAVNNTRNNRPELIEEQE